MFFFVVFSLTKMPKFDDFIGLNPAQFGSYFSNSKCSSFASSNLCVKSASLIYRKLYILNWTQRKAQGIYRVFSWEWKNILYIFQELYYKMKMYHTFDFLKFMFSKNVEICHLFWKQEMCKVRKFKKTHREDLILYNVSITSNSEWRKQIFIYSTKYDYSHETKWHLTFWFVK